MSVELVVVLCVGMICATVLGLGVLTIKSMSKIGEKFDDDKK